MPKDLPDTNWNESPGRSNKPLPALEYWLWTADTSPHLP